MSNFKPMNFLSQVKRISNAVGYPKLSIKTIEELKAELEFLNAEYPNMKVGFNNNGVLVKYIGGSVHIFYLNPQPGSDNYAYIKKTHDGSMSVVIGQDAEKQRCEFSYILANV